MSKVFRLTINEEPRSAVLLSAGLAEELGSLQPEAWNRRLRLAAPVEIRFAPPTPRHKPRAVSSCDLHFYGDKLIFSAPAFALISQLAKSIIEDFIEFISAEYGQHYCFAPATIHDCLSRTSAFHDPTVTLDGRAVPLFLKHPRFDEEAKLPGHIFQCRHPVADLRLPEVFVSQVVRNAWLADGLRGAAFDSCG